MRTLLRQLSKIAACLAAHPDTIDCYIDQCQVCGVRDCPYGDPLHYHHGGCPSCFEQDRRLRVYVER